MKGMRVVVATDGSACAHVALELAANIPWPAGSELHLVSAVEPQVAAYAPTVIGAPGDMVEREVPLVRNVQADLERAASTLAAPDCEVQAHVLVGRPANAIIESAESLGADLIIVGSRGHGTIASMLLGSVSAEVADHAHCPVLVARARGWRQVALATDGSEFARRAEDVIATWPIFANTSVAVMSIADTDLAWPSALALSGFPASYDYPAQEKEAVEEHQKLADDAAARLRGAGRDVTAVFAQGDPATTLLKQVRELSTEVLVVGTHGRTGARRAFAGSVSRNVMLHAPCSVLVVREARPAA